jgi:hypothetical protein
MSETTAAPTPLPATCPACGGTLLLAPHDPSVPTYPTCSDIIPVPEQWCSACRLSWVGEAGRLVRTATALARARHELRRIRRQQVSA